MVMVPRTITASEFKAKCLAILDEVGETGQDVVITKRGKPVARLAGLEPPPDLQGSVKILVSNEEFIAPLDEPWDALRD